MSSLYKGSNNGEVGISPSVLQGRPYGGSAIFCKDTVCVANNTLFDHKGRRVLHLVLPHPHYRFSEMNLRLLEN